MNDTHAIPPGDLPEHWYEVAPFGVDLAYSGTDRTAAIDQIVAILARSETPEIWASRLPTNWNRRDGVGIVDQAEAHAVLLVARAKLAEARQAELDAELVHAALAIPAHDDEDREVCAAEDCDACGGTVTEQFSAPAKSHDLTVRRDTTDPGRVMIGVEDATDDCRLYLPADEVKLLGRMLRHLTPAQVAILADALTDGAL